MPSPCQLQRPRPTQARAPLTSCRRCSPPTNLAPSRMCCALSQYVLHGAPLPASKPACTAPCACAPLQRSALCSCSYMRLEWPSARLVQSQPGTADGAAAQLAARPPWPSVLVHRRSSTLRTPYTLSGHLTAKQPLPQPAKAAFRSIMALLASKAALRAPLGLRAPRAVPVLRAPVRRVSVNVRARSAGRHCSGLGPGRQGGPLPPAARWDPAAGPLRPPDAPPPGHWRPGAAAMPPRGACADALRHTPTVLVTRRRAGDLTLTPAC